MLKQENLPENWQLYPEEKPVFVIDGDPGLAYEQLRHASFEPEPEPFQKHLTSLLSFSLDAALHSPNGRTLLAQQCHETKRPSSDDIAVVVSRFDDAQVNYASSLLHGPSPDDTSPQKQHRTSVYPVAIPRDAEAFGLGLKQSWGKWLNRMGKTGHFGAKLCSQYADKENEPITPKFIRWWVEKFLLCVYADITEPRLKRAQSISAPSIPLFLAETLARTPCAALEVKPQWSNYGPQINMEVSGELTREKKRPIVAPLAALLARIVWQQWQTGVDNKRWVTLPASRDGLREILGDRVDENELKAALEFLKELKAGGSPCVDNYWSERRSTKGRPKKCIVVQVGPLLAPFGLDLVFRQAGVQLPSEWRWYSPALPPERAPFVGNVRTIGVQRAFFTVGLGAYLMERREDYAKKNGVEIYPDEWVESCRKMGIWHKQDRSLAINILEGYLEQPKQLELAATRRTPVLIRKNNVYCLSETYNDAHRMIIEAGNKTIKAKNRRAKQRNKKPQS